MLLGLTACGYASQYSCKGYPDAVNCASVSESYEHRFEKGVNGADSSSGNSSKTSQETSRYVGQAESLIGRPIVSAPRVYRVWVAPWRDRKNNLHEAAVVYTMIDPGDWVYGAKPKTVQSGIARDILPRVSRSVERAERSKPAGNGGPTLPGLDAIRKSIGNSGAGDPQRGSRQVPVPGMPSPVPQGPMSGDDYGDGLGGSMP